MDLDFGLARAAVPSDQTARLTLSGFVGTPQYASPEQIEERDLDSRSDIYSLGVTLWYMLCGQPPFTGSIFRISSQHLTMEPPWERLGHLPAPVLALLARMLQKEPADRPQTPVKLRHEIEACLRQLPATARAAAPLGFTIGPAGTVASGSDDGLASGALRLPESSVQSDAPVAEAVVRRGFAPAAGRTFMDRYVLLERVGEGGEGGVGEVFRATDSLEADRPVAVKVLHSSPGPSTPEFTLLRDDLDRLHAAPHLRLVETYALEQVHGHRFMVSEWIRGFRLVDLLNHRGRLEVSEALQLLEQACDAAAHCGAHGLRRLGLGTHQILVQFPDVAAGVPEDFLRQPLARWPEFGLKCDAFTPAREASHAPTWSGMVTLVAAPRAANHDRHPHVCGPPEDNYLYRLGALCYELLSGAPPPPPEDRTRELRPLAALAEEANEVLRRALSPDAGFGDGREFFAALVAATAPAAVVPPPRLSAPKGNKTAAAVPVAPLRLVSPTLAPAPPETERPVSAPTRARPVDAAVVSLSVGPAPAAEPLVTRTPGIPPSRAGPLAALTTPAAAKSSRSDAPPGRNRARLLLATVGISLVLTLTAIALYSSKRAYNPVSLVPVAAARTERLPPPPAPAANGDVPMPLTDVPSVSATPPPAAAQTLTRIHLEKVSVPPTPSTAPTAVPQDEPVAPLIVQTPPAPVPTPVETPAKTSQVASAPTPKAAESTRPARRSPPVDAPTPPARPEHTAAHKDRAPDKRPAVVKVKPEQPPRPPSKAPPSSRSNSDDAMPGFMR